jgi:hypothetical protein
MVYARLQNWEEATVCFERALEQWQGLNDTWNLINTLSELVGLRTLQGDWRRARARLDEAWALVVEQDEARYDMLKRELLDRRHVLQGLATSL